MHIETLDAVHRESKRLPPIQKVTNSYFYLPLDKGLAEPQPAPPSPLSTNPYISQCHSRYVCLPETACDAQHARAVHAGWLLVLFGQLIDCLQWWRMPLKDAAVADAENICHFTKDKSRTKKTFLLCECPIPLLMARWTGVGWPKSAKCTKFSGIRYLVHLALLRRYKVQVEDMKSWIKKRKVSW